MAPHLDAHELDMIASRSEEDTAVDLLKAIRKRRVKKGVAAPKIWAIRRAMRGKTHKRSRSETRGRPKSLSPIQIKRLNSCRRKLIKKADAEHEVTYDLILRSARLRNKVHRTTVARELAHLGIRWRPLREKPPRTRAQEGARVKVCKEWRKKPKSFWTKKVDLIIDNKKFPLCSTEGARKRLRQQRARGVLRSPAEGLSSGFTKPSIHKHRCYTGGCVNILAGVCGDRIVLWEEVNGRWSADVASKMYAGPVKKALQRHRPGKRSWLIMEDNDPTGYKSNKAKKTKKMSAISTLDQPVYSPDLNPLDFSLWSAIWTKVLANAPKNETQAQFKARLRRTALRLPASFVGKAVMSIKKRAEAIVNAEGKNIKID